MNLGILRALGIVFFLYLTWRSLKDDYKDSDLIGWAWLAIVSFLVGSRVSYGLINFGVFKDVWEWLAVWKLGGANYVGGYLAMMGVTAWWLVKKEWKIWSFLEDVSSVWLVFLGFLTADELLRAGLDINLAVPLFVLVLTLILTAMIKNNYRSYVWYKSGKKGFVFLFANFCVWFLMTIFWVIGDKSVLGAVIAATLSLISVAGLVILGEVIEPLKIYNRKR